MTVERMLTEEEPAGELVGRVLQEAGIEYVFGISGGHTGRIVSGLRKYQNSLRMVLVREELLAGVMAEVYGRLTRRPGVMIGQGPWVLGNGLIGTMEAFLSSSPMLLLTDFSDSTPFHLHAPYQQATGDYGSWDARRAFSGVTKQVMQAHTPTAAVQATQLAIKHALAGQAGPVAVLFAMDSLSGTVRPDLQPVLYPTRYYLPSPPPPADAARVAEAAKALLAAERPVVIAGNGVPDHWQHRRRANAFGLGDCALRSCEASATDDAIWTRLSGMMMFWSASGRLCGCSAIRWLRPQIPTSRSSLRGRLVSRFPWMFALYVTSETHVMSGNYGRQQKRETMNFSFWRRKKRPRSGRRSE